MLWNLAKTNKCFIKTVALNPSWGITPVTSLLLVNQKAPQRKMMMMMMMELGNLNSLTIKIQQWFN